VVQNNKIQIQDGGQPPYCKMLETRIQPLPSNGTLNIQQLSASGGQTREPILMKFGTPQQIKTSVTVT